MARPYADVLPAFAAALDRALGCFDAELAGRARRALLEASFPEAEFDETDLAQPALFAFGYAAAAGLTEVGVTASAVVGHSMGEIVAATIAGVLSLSDAASFIAARGQAMRVCEPGAMLGLGCDADHARRLIDEADADLEIASVNGQANCVVSGPVAAIEAFGKSIGDAVWNRRLRTTRAFHSRLIDPALSRLAAALASATVRPPNVPIAMNVSGEIIAAGAEVAPVMLVEQARRPVLFWPAITALADLLPDAVAVEVGPGRGLSAMAESAGLTAMSLGGGKSSATEESILGSLGTLWSIGQSVDVAALCPSGQRLHLPGYVFGGPRWVIRQAGGRPGQDPIGSQSPEPADGEAAGDPRGRVAAIWSDLLGHGDLTGSSDFFDLGGDSLLFTRLARRVNDEFGVKVPLRQMLAERTLGGQQTIVAALVQQVTTPDP
jgi:acyl transferase domain-containing protein